MLIGVEGTEDAEEEEVDEAVETHRAEVDEEEAGVKRTNMPSL